jgi:hypothetical protein
MTAIASRASRPLSSSRDALLRFAMRADATLTALCGLIVAAAADPLSRMTGLTPAQEWIAGAGFVAYGAIVYALAAVNDLRVAAAAVITGNYLFSAFAVLAVVAGWFALTGFGVAVILATGVVTLLFADLQYLGVRRLRA